MSPYGFKYYNNVRLITKLNANNINDNYGNYTEVLIDNNFDIVPNSVYWDAYNYNEFNRNIKCVHNNESLSNNIVINEKCLMVTQWMKSYGHLLDSLTILYDFYVIHNLQEQNYKVIISIPPNEKNILDIANIFFGTNLINIYEYESKYNCVNISEILLIENNTNVPCFLSLPDSARQKLYNSLNDPTIVSKTNVFISRPYDVNNPSFRLLKNQIELEEVFRNNNFDVIIPDNMSNKELYNIVKQAKNIVITNGSALCSLVFINTNTKIFCVNSRAYLPAWRQPCRSEGEIDNSLWSMDNFEKNIWRNATSKYNFTYIDSFENIISESQYNYILNNLQ